MVNTYYVCVWKCNITYIVWSVPEVSTWIAYTHDALRACDWPCFEDIKNTVKCPVEIQFNLVLPPHNLSLIFPYDNIFSSTPVFNKQSLLWNFTKQCFKAISMSITMWTPRSIHLNVQDQTTVSLPDYESSSAVRNILNESYH
jgi:hypothetical protein